jgi:tRNA A-37 threonylcarbamoyl transferase component Bud32
MHTGDMIVQVPAHTHSCMALHPCYTVLQALAAVHDAGLAHGDIHYSNIIMQGDKVSGFIIEIAFAPATWTRPCCQAQYACF